MFRISRGVPIASRAEDANSDPSRELDEKKFWADCLVEDVKWLGYSKVILKATTSKPLLSSSPSPEGIDDQWNCKNPRGASS